MDLQTLDETVSKLQKDIWDETQKFVPNGLKVLKYLIEIDNINEEYGTNYMTNNIVGLDSLYGLTFPLQK